MQCKSLNTFDSIRKVCREIKLELDYNFLYHTSYQVFAFFLFIEFKIETIGIRAFIQFDQKLCKRTSIIIHLSSNWLFAFYCLKSISFFLSRSTEFMKLKYYLGRILNKCDLSNTIFHNWEEFSTHVDYFKTQWIAA